MEAEKFFHQKTNTFCELCYTLLHYLAVRKEITVITVLIRDAHWPQMIISNLITYHLNFAMPSILWYLLKFCFSSPIYATHDNNNKGFMCLSTLLYSLPHPINHQVLQSDTFIRTRGASLSVNWLRFHSHYTKLRLDVVRAN